MSNFSPLVNTRVKSLPVGGEPRSDEKKNAGKLEREY